ncbi:hypothetical protein AYJ54_13790 [Bradyrhizobium centrolobii]|uniref:Uncharacterized protein n=1 Tax=Bradyrhizobium centrolobii TaxID=1505087 RepID=A0A176YPP2_9BRAD|nr:hypothetical protein AYJ54_13790 [Bradyrhizobium centrolobii]
MHRLLDQPVHHRRDAQLAHPSAGLGDFHPAHRLRPVAAFQQFFPDARPMLLQIRLQLLHGHPIDARGALVRHDPMVGRHHVISADDLLHQPHFHLRKEGCGLAVVFDAPVSCSGGFRPLPSERA